MMMMTSTRIFPSQTTASIPTTSSSSLSSSSSCFSIIRAAFVPSGRTTTMKKKKKKTMLTFQNKSAFSRFFFHREEGYFVERSTNFDDEGKERGKRMSCNSNSNASGTDGSSGGDKIPPIETISPGQFDDLSREELQKELAASFEIRAAMAAKLELVEDQLRATVSEVCKILALKREAEFELKRMKQTYETVDDDEKK